MCVHTLLYNDWLFEYLYQIPVSIVCVCRGGGVLLTCCSPAHEEEADDLPPPPPPPPPLLLLLLLLRIALSLEESWVAFLEAAQRC